MRRAASGIARCLKATPSKYHLESPCWPISRNRSTCGVATASLSSFQLVQSDHLIRNISAFGAAASSPSRRHLSSKASSDSSPESSHAASGSAESPTAASSLQTLASSEGASKSLTGPRITSKKGYLDRENMIRETQKAIRQYYKEGMYQVRLLCMSMHHVMAWVILPRTYRYGRVFSLKAYL